jgi:hypothetical protein
MRSLISILTCVGFVVWSAFAADYPQAEIANERISVKLYLPDSQSGFYRSTRFDWSGVIAGLQFEGNNYYGPWFTKFDPTVRDFSYKDNDIIVGAISAVTGPVEEFQKPVGYDTAKPGQTFLKVGVGVLRKPDNTAYGAFKHYDLIDPGKWTVEKGSNFAIFVQEVAIPGSGYGYAYTKTVRLTMGKPEMVIEHSLRNLGRLPIRTNVYDHNFLVLDQAPTGPDFVITLPFEIKTARQPDAEFAEIRKNQIAYLKTLTNQDRVAFPIEGFSGDPKDYEIRIENRKLGAGMRITGDRPLASESLWSIRSVLAVEPFIDVVAKPGEEFTWKYTYTYYTVAKGN